MHLSLSSTHLTQVTSRCTSSYTLRARVLPSVSFLCLFAPQAWAIMTDFLQIFRPTPIYVSLSFLVGSFQPQTFSFQEKSCKSPCVSCTHSRRRTSSQVQELSSLVPFWNDSQGPSRFSCEGSQYQWEAPSSRRSSLFLFTSTPWLFWPLLDVLHTNFEFLS